MSLGVLGYVQLVGNAYTLEILPDTEQFNSVRRTLKVLVQQRLRGGTRLLPSATATLSHHCVLEIKKT